MKKYFTHKYNIELTCSIDKYSLDIIVACRNFVIINLAASKTTLNALNLKLYGA